MKKEEFSKVKNQVVRIASSYKTHGDDVYAAQASYYIIIAAIPFLMLLMMILQQVPILSGEDVMEVMKRIIPENLQEFVYAGILSAEVKSPKTFISIAAIVTLWSAAGGMLSVEQGLSRINECTKHSNGITRRLKATGFTVLFVFAIVDMLLVMVLGKWLTGLIAMAVPTLSLVDINDFFDVISILTVGLLFVCIIGIYIWLPLERQKPVRQLPGAVFSTLCWLAFSKLFALYFSLSDSMSQIYGSLTAIVLFMIWIKMDIMILFVGAEINRMIPGTFSFKRKLSQTGQTDPEERKGKKDE